jgi:hypothetical protein
MLKGQQGNRHDATDSRDRQRVDEAPLADVLTLAFCADLGNARNGDARMKSIASRIMMTA